MKIYAKLTWITGFTAILSFLEALALHLFASGRYAEFCCDVGLAIFGSALLAAVTSGATYWYEKHRTMEEFSKKTASLLHMIKKYSTSWDDEQKINFYLDLDDVDTTAWDGYMRDITFMYDPHRHKYRYIYERIYFPIETLIRSVARHERHFRYHKEALRANPDSIRDGEVMKEFIEELETIFIEKEEYKVTDSDGKELIFTGISNKLVHSVFEELNGHYYDLIYGRKKEKSNG